jgi:hypothetical protein
VHVSATPDGSHPSRSSRATVLAWLICAVSVGGMLGAVGFQVFSSNSFASGSESALEEILLLTSFAALPVIGTLVASQHPRNAVGWLLLAVGAGIGVLILSAEYAVWALDQRPAYPPGFTLAALLAEWLWIPSVSLLFTLTFLLFPNGRPPSPRWRWLVWVSGATIVLTVLAGMLQDQVDVDGISLDNPLGIGLFDDAEAALGPVFPILGILSVMCAASLVVRFRRSHGDERQQLKWLAFSVSFLVITFFIELPGSLAVGLLTVDASLAVAMLKYRLYDIDRVINRTLVYGFLTALLVAGYAGGVLLLQTVLPLPDDSPAATAASTLAMAALFGPLRRRVQQVVDRYFYRPRYNAIKTVEAFESRVRLQSDLDGLAGDLVDVVRRTVHPSHVSVWLARTEEETS